MKKFKYLLLPGLLFFIVFFTGCGASVKNSISIDENGAGSRNIVCTIKNEDVKRLRGGIESIDEVIKSNKPEVLNLKKLEVTDGIQYVFSYDFKNLDEYILKTEKIIGKKPDSKISVSGGLFNKSYQFTESNISEELIKWAADSIAKSWIEIISPKDVYEIEATEVKFSGKTQSFDGDIKIVQNKIYEMERIEINTTINRVSGYGREILYSFSESTNSALNKNNNELNSFMLGLIPKGGKLKKIEEGNLVTYKISYDSNDIRGLNEKTRIASMDERASISINTAGGNSISEKIEEVTENIDFSKLLEGGKAKSGVIYRFEIPEKYSFKKVGETGVDEKADNVQVNGGGEITSNAKSRLLTEKYPTSRVDFSAQYKSKGQMGYLILGVILMVVMVISGVFLTKLIISKQEGRFRRKSSDTMEKTWSFETDWTLNSNQKDDIDQTNQP